jgi:adenosylmethionine-8-amino-7-oxononanoate aminotransferase
MWAVEFVADKQTKEPFPDEKKFAARVNELAMKRGVILYPMQGCADGKRGDHVMIAPPAVITADELRWAVEQVANAVREALSSLGQS